MFSVPRFRNDSFSFLSFSYSIMMFNIDLKKNTECIRCVVRDREFLQLFSLLCCLSMMNLVVVGE